MSAGNGYARFAPKTESASIIQDMYDQQYSDLIGIKESGCSLYGGCRGRTTTTAGPCEVYEQECRERG